MFAIKLQHLITFAAVVLVWGCCVTFAQAATMQLAPATGVFQAGATFTVDVQVRPQGQPVNAAEGTITFNPNELSVVSVNRTGSIFNLWVAEPSFSNSAGTISYSGGVPSGYSGTVGRVLQVTFRTKGAGSPRVSFTTGSVLANDGRGTNVLTTMNGGSYTVSAANAAPTPEVIIEYVPAANTPGRPNVTSSTHGDPDNWYSATTAELAWTVPAGVTSMRTLLNSNPTSVPTRVYENPISSITLNDLVEGVSYFHVQFRNADGWGTIRHYRLAVDTIAPAGLTVAMASSSEAANPRQILEFDSVEETSGIARYLIKLDAAEPYEFIPDADATTHQLPPLEPGYHTVIVEAFDAAGNSTIGTFSFTINSFEQPTFSDIPTDMSTNVVPVFTGNTRPNATVEVYFNRLGSEPTTYELISNADGVFTFIPDAQLFQGVYELSARATDEFGAQSDVSEVYRIAVQAPGFIRIGTQVVDAMSVIVPLILLAILLVFGVWYMLFVYRRFKDVVEVESAEALTILQREFVALHETVAVQREKLIASRKTKKLTQAEADTIKAFNDALDRSKKAVAKEIKDVTDLT